MLAPAAADAVDGRIDLTALRQSGGAGDSAYRTDSLLEAYGLGQRTPLNDHWVLTADLAARREQLEGWALGLRTYTRTRSLLPKASLSFRQGDWMAAVDATGSVRDWSGSQVAPYRDENIGVLAWTRGQVDRLDIYGSLRARRAWRRAEGADRENRERNAMLTLRHPVLGADELRYTYSTTRQEQITAGNRYDDVQNQVRYQGSRAFAGDRLRVSVDAYASHHRTEGFREAAGDGRLLVPVWGGFALDDTPEFLDPLEDDPIAEGRLYDGNRDARTGINIGDAAPAVREYGGDWRNIIIDLGEAEPVTSTALFVDTRVNFPGFFDWLVFVSDDPEGRDWGTALDRADYAVVYTDLADGRQGWQFTFAQPIEHRRLKIVDRKVGVTEPDIYITEWEIYGPVSAATPDVERIAQGRLRGDVRYRLAAAVELSYGTELQERRYLDDDRRLDRAMHRFGARWSLAAWTLQAHHQTDRLTSPNGRNTDANGQGLALSRGNARDMAWRFAYTRTEDRSYTARHVTHGGSAGMTWHVLPALEWDQRLTYGVRDAEDVEGTAHSWAVVTVLRGDVRPNLDLQLRRSDRWSDREAGSGFTTYSDTESAVTWAVMPQVVVTSEVVYRVREAAHWVLRHNVSWSPLPGGSVDIRLYAMDFQDTQSGYLRRGGGGLVTWRPRPRLRLESGVEYVLVKEDDERNTPLNLSARGRWTF